MFMKVLYCKSGGEGGGGVEEGEEKGGLDGRWVNNPCYYKRISTT